MPKITIPSYDKTEFNLIKKLYDVAGEQLTSEKLKDAFKTGNKNFIKATKSYVVSVLNDKINMFVEGETKNEPDKAIEMIEKVKESGSRYLADAVKDNIRYSLNRLFGLEEKEEKEVKEESTGSIFRDEVIGAFSNLIPGFRTPRGQGEKTKRNTYNKVVNAMYDKFTKLDLEGQDNDEIEILRDFLDEIYVRAGQKQGPRPNWFNKVQNIFLKDVEIEDEPVEKPLEKSGEVETKSGESHTLPGEINSSGDVVNALDINDDNTLSPTEISEAQLNSQLMASIYQYNPLLEAQLTAPFPMASTNVRPIKIIREDLPVVDLRRGISQVPMVQRAVAEYVEDRDIFSTTFN